MDHTAALLILCTLLFVGGIHGALQSLLAGRSLTIALVLFMIALAFGLAPWLSLFSRDSGGLPSFDMEAQFVAYLGLGLFCAGLLLAAYLGPKLPGVAVITRATLAQGASLSMFSALLGFGMVYAARLMLAVNYKILLPAANDLQLQAEMSTYPYWVIISNQYTRFFLFGFYGWAAVHLFRPGKARIAAILIIAAQLPLIFCEGRRALLEHAFYLSIGFFATKRTQKMAWKAMVTSGVLAVLVLVILNPIFLVFRTSYHDNMRRTRSSTESLRLSIENLLTMSDLRMESQEVSKENLSNRTLLVRFNIEIAEAEANRPYLFGSALFNSIIFAVPQFMIPGKAGKIESEIMIREHFHLPDPTVDVASNWAAFGLADFGLVGCFVYGLFFGTLLIRGEMIGRMIVDYQPFLGLCLIVSLLNLSLAVEMDPYQVFVTFRNAALLVLLAVMARSVSSTRIATRTTMGGEFPRPGRLG